MAIDREARTVMREAMLTTWLARADAAIEASAGEHLDALLDATEEVVTIPAWPLTYTTTDPEGVVGARLAEWAVTVWPDEAHLTSRPHPDLTWDPPLKLPVEE